MKKFGNLISPGNLNRLAEEEMKSNEENGSVHFDDSEMYNESEDMSNEPLMYETVIIEPTVLPNKSEEVEFEKSLKEYLAEWYTDYGVEKTQCDKLLEILRHFGHDLPMSTNSLIQGTYKQASKRRVGLASKTFEKFLEEVDDQEMKIDLHSIPFEFDGVKCGLSRVERQLAKQTIILQKLTEKLDPPKSNINIFPLNSMQSLNRIDDKIKLIPQKELIQHIKEIVGKTPLYKCIDLFFTENVLLQINWDGTKERIPINKLKIFNSYVFEAVKNADLGYKEYENQMRKGIRAAKCKQYKRRMQSK